MLFYNITGQILPFENLIYLEELKPSFGYRKEIAKLTDKKKQNLLNNLEKIKNNLIHNYKLEKNILKIDENKIRLLTSIAIAQRIKEPGLICAVVTEYPTWDATEIEIDFI